MLLHSNPFFDMNQQTQSFIDYYVEQHSGMRWMDCGELKQLLTEFSGKIEAQHQQFREDVKAMRQKQNEYFAERKAHGFGPVASRLLAESRALEKTVDAQLSDEPTLF